MAGRLRPAAWIEQGPTHKRHMILEALVCGSLLDPWARSATMRSSLSAHMLANGTNWDRDVA